MAIGNYTYGTVAGVHRRISWVVPNRQYFDGHTTPTLADVETALDQIASEMHMLLAAGGYPINTAASVLTNSPRASAFLAALNEDGAAAQIAMLFPTAGDSETGENRPAAYWEKRYRKGLELFGSEALTRLSLSREADAGDLAYSGSTHDDTTGEDKVPLFTRGMTDYPNSRELTEA